MRLIVIAAASALLTVACASTQTAPSKEQETFTAQAAKGATLFADHCAKCHGASGEGDMGPRVVGLSAGALPLDPPAERKKRTTQFRTVADVAAFAVVNMPGDDPGSLAAEDYWRILAFDLKANGVDLGSKHLDQGLAQTLVIPR